MRVVTRRVVSLLWLCGVVLVGGGGSPARGQDGLADLPDGALRADLQAVEVPVCAGRPNPAAFHVRQCFR